MTVSQQKTMRVTSVCLLAVCILSVTHSALTQLSDPLQLNWDVSMYLHFAQSLLSGGLPYVDFLDINPPLIIYLSCLPAWIAHLLDVHVIVVFKLLLVMLSLVSVGLIFLTVRKRAAKDPRAFYIVSALLVVANIGSFVDREFGQREHIFVLSFLPFFFVRWLRWESEEINSALAIVAGMMAAVGLCLKPHFLVMPLICELYWVYRHRTWKMLVAPEIFACILVGVLYPLHFLVIPDAMRRPFLQLVAEFPLFQSFYGSSTLVCCLLGGNHWPEIFIAFVCACVAGICLRKQHSLVVPVLLYTLAAYACVILQHKHWDYYKIPMWIGILMMFGCFVSWMIYLIAKKLDKQLGSCDQRACAAAITALFLLLFVLLDAPKISKSIDAWQIEEPHVGEDVRGSSSALERALTIKSKTNSTLAILMQHSKPGDGAMMMCDILMPAYPTFLQYGMKIGCRYPFQFSLIVNHLSQRRALDSGDQSAAKRFGDRVEQECNLILSDVRKNRPRVIIIQQNVRALDSLLFDRSTHRLSNFGNNLLEGYRYVATYQDHPDNRTWTYKLYLRESEVR